MGVGFLQYRHNPLAYLCRPSAASVRRSGEMPAVPPTCPLGAPTITRAQSSVGRDGTMTPRKFTAFVLVLVFALTLVGMFVHSGSKATASSPYQSALSSVGVASAEAAKKNCANRACEFASPGYVCLEGSGTKCVFGGGCTTVSCSH